MRIFSIIVILMIAESAQAATLSVCHSGCEYSSIQAAIDAASPGDTIAVQSGDYNEQVVLNKDIKLRGNGDPSISQIYKCGHPDSSVAGFTIGISVAGCPNADTNYVEGNTVTVGGNTVTFVNPTADNAAIIKNTETSTLLDSINFSRDQPQIPTGNQKKSTLTYNKDGKLHFNIFQKDYFTSYILLRNKALRTFRDCVVETEATQEGGPDDNGYGIILRYVDDSNFYRFRISGKGNYGFDKMQNHEWFDIVPWTNSAAINTGNEANRIKVECNGDNFTFYVNDVKLGDCTDKSFATGGIGLVAETHSMGGVHVSFNGIKVWALLPEDSTESAQKLKVEPQLSRAQARLNEAQNKLNQLNLRK